MNPILEALKKRKQEPAKKQSKGVEAYRQILSEIRAGNVDAKEKAMDMLGGMTPAMRFKLQLALPMIEKLAKQNCNESQQAQVDEDLNTLKKLLRGGK